MIKNKLWNADGVRYSILTRARIRRRPRRGFSTFDFEDEHEYDDEDDITRCIRRPPTLSSNTFFIK